MDICVKLYSNDTGKKELDASFHFDQLGSVSTEMVEIYEADKGYLFTPKDLVNIIDKYEEKIYDLIVEISKKEKALKEAKEETYKIEFMLKPFSERDYLFKSIESLAEQIDNDRIKLKIFQKNAYAFQYLFDTLDVYGEDPSHAWYEVFAKDDNN